MNPAAILAIDPLLSGDIGMAEVLIVLLKTLVAFGLLLVSVIFMIWFERKLIGDFQNRVGPNKAGPWGLLQTLADGLKLIMKEDLIPDKADRLVFRLAPFLSAVPAFVTFAVVSSSSVSLSRSGIRISPRRSSFTCSGMTIIPSPSGRRLTAKS